MARFILKVLAYTVAATILWWLCPDVAGPLTVDAAKRVHDLVGAPAPYLILDMMHYWWLAPPVQLFVGLTLAASWLSWRRRLICLATGVIFLWFVVVMGVIAMSSPYLGTSTARIVISNILVKGHLIVTPVIFWLILVGAPPASLLAADAPKGGVSKNAIAGRSSKRWWPRGVLGASLCMVLSLLLYALAATAPEPVVEARRALAASLRSGDLRQSVVNAARLGKTERTHARKDDQRIRYLMGRLGLQAALEEPEDDLRRKMKAAAYEQLFHDSINPSVRSALHQELGPLRGPTASPTRSDAQDAPG